MKNKPASAPRLLAMYRWTFVALALAAPAGVRAQAGPPYLTDDPDPVPLHHFEAYAFELSDTTANAGTSLSAPSFEINYGAAPNLQLHLVIPFVTVYGNGVTTAHGFGDVEIGAKYKLLDEKKYLPEIGVFPFVELPLGDATRGLGVGSTWYRVPMWLKKGFGKNWSIYGGGGAVFAHGNEFENAAFASGLVQRKFGKKLVLGVELFGHGEEAYGAGAIGRATLMNAGGFYSFGDHFQIMAAAGHSVFWNPETYTYMAAYWTWGHNKDDDKKDSAQTAQASHFGGAF
jgi:hypothetical protein